MSDADWRQLIDLLIHMGLRVVDVDRDKGTVTVQVPPI